MSGKATKMLIHNKLYNLENTYFINSAKINPSINNMAHHINPIRAIAEGGRFVTTVKKKP